MSHVCISTIIVVFFVFIGFVTADLPKDKVQMYKKCLKLTKDNLTKMVGIMSGQVPLKAAMKDEAKQKPSTTMDYTNIMNSLAKFLTEAKDAREFVQIDGHEFSINTIGPAYPVKLRKAENFLKVHRIFMEKLAQYCGKFGRWTKVEKVLDKTVECAMAVHKQYVAEKENASNEQKEGLLTEDMWKKLDATFETAIHKITHKVD